MSKLDYEKLDEITTKITRLDSRIEDCEKQYKHIETTGDDYKFHEVTFNQDEFRWGLIIKIRQKEIIAGLTQKIRTMRSERMSLVNKAEKIAKEYVKGAL